MSELQGDKPRRMAAHGAPTLTLCALAGDYPELFAEQVASQLTPEELLHKVCP
jgi:hypothetical protein